MRKYTQEEINADVPELDRIAREWRQYQNADIDVTEEELDAWERMELQAWLEEGMEPDYTEEEAWEM